MHSVMCWKLESKCSLVSFAPLTSNCNFLQVQTYKLLQLGWIGAGPNIVCCSTHVWKKICALPPPPSNVSRATFKSLQFLPESCARRLVLARVVTSLTSTSSSSLVSSPPTSIDSWRYVVRVNVCQCDRGWVLRDQVVVFGCPATTAATNKFVGGCLLCFVLDEHRCCQPLKIDDRASHLNK